jgi:hypothetical protein
MLGSSIGITRWSLDHDGTRRADFMVRYRLASTAELGIDRLTTGLSEACVGLASGPVAILLIQLGRTLWSPMGIIFTSLQSSGTRAVATASIQERPMASARLHLQALTGFAVAALLLVAAVTILPSGYLNTDRTERVLAVSVTSIYFLASNYGLSARVLLRITKRMRTLVKIQTVGGVTGLIFSLALASFAPWYISLIVGNFVMVAVAVAMRHVASHPLPD